MTKKLTGKVALVTGGSRGIGAATARALAADGADIADMTTIKTSDDTELYYKDWGSGQPVVFSHGWPLSADAWEDQMVFLGAQLHTVRAETVMTESARS